MKDYKAYKALLSVLQRLQKEKKYLIAAIDGRCAAGKTTLAAQIQLQTGCNVIHMDDFFLRPEQRTKERLSQPGGNVDWERFLQEVLIPLRRGEEALYRPYNCHTQTLMEEIKVEPKAIVLVEGSYSCHPQLWEYYDLHVFLSVPEEEQLRRIEERNGKEGLAVFREKWIPLEEQYFKAYSIAERCEMQL